MEFRLTYEGPLLSNSDRSAAVRRTRADNKQEIRQAFHRQLKRLWQVTPMLKRAAERPPATPVRPGEVRGVAWAQLRDTLGETAEKYAMFGYRFVPLATHELDLSCSVDVLLMRPESLGGVIQKSGDIDNGFKVIFDALSKPRTAAQLGRYITPSGGEDPFFCLLEDDKLITQASVQTDLMLEPLKGTETLSSTDARVIVKVRLVPSNLNVQNAGFA